MRVRDVGENGSRIVMMRTADYAVRKDADFRQVADHGKDEEKFYRRQHGQTPGLRASGPTGDGAADGQPQTEYESV